VFFNGNFILLVEIHFDFFSETDISLNILLKFLFLTSENKTDISGLYIKTVLSFY